ncbi:MAG: glycosyltransferase [Candidatus Abyssubacteria bacterium]
MEANFRGNRQMIADSALSEQAQKDIDRIASATIMVGVPSYNNASTIGHVAEVAGRGLAAFFPDSKALLINSDDGSRDNTPDVFLNSATPKNINKLSVRYQGMPGKGSALKAIFEAAVRLGVRACVVVDSDLRSITPEWIRWLGGPLMEGAAGYVTPLYLRHKYDGTITNSLAYPFTRALYGMRVRQPIGGDFGVSGALAETYLAKQVWNTTAAQFGIDIFMTTTAINEGFEICQANLGAKIHDVKDPAADLGPMFRQVVGTMFALMKTYEDKWMAVKSSKTPPSVGPPFQQEPGPVQVTFSALTQKFRNGVAERMEFWKQFLPDAMLDELDRLAALGDNAFVFPARLWTHIVYEFATAYNIGAPSGAHAVKLDPVEIVDSLTPLYFGRTAGFVRETADMNNVQANAVIERLAELYEEEKPYLIELWRTR